MVVLIRTLIS